MRRRNMRLIIVGLVLVVAAVRRLALPAILGYLAVGMLLGGLAFHRRDLQGE